MKLNSYTIFDTASGAYMRPFFMPADGQATRAFADIANDPEHEVGKHPEDYYLIRNGIFDDQTARYTPEELETLMTGLEAVASRKKQNQGQVDFGHQAWPRQEIKAGGTD